MEWRHSSPGGTAQWISGVADALIIFKPDAAHRLAVRAGIWAWLSSERDWKVESLEWFQPPADLIESHYDFLQGRPFFPWLVDFMTALPLVVGRVTASARRSSRCATTSARRASRSRGPARCASGYGIFGGLNCLHLSDAPETGAAEVKRWSEFVQLDKVEVQLDKTSRQARPHLSPALAGHAGRRRHPRRACVADRCASCWPRSRT